MISNEEFRAALGLFASGVTVITTKDATGKMFGLTASAFSSVSLNPPLILVCIDKKTGSHHAFEESGKFVVNILNENQKNLSNHFASKVEDKFAEVNFQINADNLPLLDDCLANLECSLKHSYQGGDHTIFVGEIDCVTLNDGNPLLYFHGKYGKFER